MRLYGEAIAVHNHQLKIRGVLSSFPDARLCLVKTADGSETVARFALCTNVSKKAVEPALEKNYYLYRIKCSAE